MQKVEPTKIFDSYYYKINKYLLRKIGLWPYLSKTKKNVSLTVFTIISFSLIIPILAGFKRVWGPDMVPVIENCVGILYLTAIYSKYLSAYIFENRIKLVYEQTVRDWKSLTDEAELKILHKHSNQGRFLTILYAGYSIVAVTVFNSFPYLPLVMDHFMPQNETRLRVYPYHPDYFFIDSEKYFFQLFTYHGIFVVAISTAAVAAIDSMMVANIKHACGLFEIVCFRLQNIGKLNDEESRKYSLVEDEEIYRSIREACNLHRSSMDTVDKIQNSFGISFLVVMLFGAIAIAMLMFDMLFTKDESLKLAIIVVLMIGVKICLLYLNWIVQQVINESEKVFNSAYSSDWYNLSVSARKLLILIMRKSLNPCSLTAGNILALNLQIFASVVKTSMSYATVMLQMQST